MPSRARRAVAARTAPAAREPPRPTAEPEGRRACNAGACRAPTSSVYDVAGRVSGRTPPRPRPAPASSRCWGTPATPPGSRTFAAAHASGTAPGLGAGLRPALELAQDGLRHGLQRVEHADAGGGAGLELGDA